MFDESAERRAILALGQALQDAWNRGDAAGYASLFTDDADFVAWNGTYGRGRQAIENGHRRLFAGSMADSRMVLVGDDAESEPPGSLRFVRPDVALMVIPGMVTPAGQRATGPDHESVQTFVLAKDASGWRVAAFHNTRRQVQP
ncbi:MAG: SgcJ/EcaC family oxidoreductase [Nocardiopsaceae bacterium]|nr:SgcJ/EcaC family oxidoreductase [Nocardiopsaceae bacterium]